MQVFNADIKRFWFYEMKSWLWTLLLATLVYIVYYRISSANHDKLIIGIIVLLLLKTANLFTQYRVTRIEINKKNNEISLVLKSLMAVEKVKKYELGQVHSELIINSGLKKLVISPNVLILFLSPKDTFHITHRYGFSPETLAAINNTLK
ncbi:MAG TPA: hypothetical protein VIM79_23645 [Niastella sp.]